MAPWQLVGRILLSFAIGATLLVILFVDWTVGHMRDSSWHPHARFHILMYHGTVLILSVVALYWLWGPLRYNPTSLQFALVVPLAVWLPFYPAALFPGVSVYATEAMAKEGVPVNLIIGAVMLAVSLLGYFLARSATVLPG